MIRWLLVFACLIVVFSFPTTEAKAQCGAGACASSCHASQPAALFPRLRAGQPLLLPRLRTNGPLLFPRLRTGQPVFSRVRVRASRVWRPFARVRVFRRWNR